MRNNSNPVLRSFEKVEHQHYGNAMTLGGTMFKTAFLFFFFLAGALAVWMGIGNLGVSSTMAIGTSLAAFVVALVVFFAPRTAPVTAPIYAILQGISLGSVTAYLNTIVPGLPLQALVITIGVFITMFLIYRSGLIKVTDKFRSVLTTAIFAILIVYLLNFALSLFGINVPFIHQGGVIGILFSLFVIGIASLSFLLDFDNIAYSVRTGAPKYMEWIGAFGLIVTFIWLYVEVLNLLRILQED